MVGFGFLVLVIQAVPAEQEVEERYGSSRAEFQDLVRFTRMVVEVARAPQALDESGSTLM